MKKARSTENQIVAVLNQVNGGQYNSGEPCILMRLQFAINTFGLRDTISENNSQQSMPAVRYVAKEYWRLSMPTIFAYRTLESISA
jgi:hypothetical protein